MKVTNTDGSQAYPTIEELTKQLGEARPLPTGRAEFEEWATRIISGVIFKADPRSLRFALTQMLLQLAPTEAYKPDAFFIKALHVSATKQVAYEVANELKIQATKEIEEEEKANALTVVTSESNVAVQQ